MATHAAAAGLLLLTAALTAQALGHPAFAVTAGRAALACLGLALAAGLLGFLRRQRDY